MTTSDTARDTARPTAGPAAARPAPEAAIVTGPTAASQLPLIGLAGPPRAVLARSALALQRAAGNRAALVRLQRDASDVTRSTITAEYAQRLTPDEIVERLPLLEAAMARLDAQGARHGVEYTTLYTNRRLLRDALGAAGRTAEQEMLASRYRMPPLSAQEQSRLRLAIGGTRAWEALEHRDSLGRQFGANQRRGMGIANFTQQSRDARVRADEILARELAALGLSTPEELVRLIEVQVPAMVLPRAKQVALGMLAENERIVRAELTRYGTGAEPGDLRALRSADRELQSRAQAVSRLIGQLQAIQTGGAAHGRNQRRGMGIANLTAATVEDAAQLTERVEIARAEFEQVRSGFALRFPVLAGVEYQPGIFADATPQQLAQRAAAPLHTILNNIARVRREVTDDDIKVWAINRAISTAMLEMGIAGRPEMARAVQRAVERHQASDAFRQLMIGVFALGTTLLSGPLMPFVGAAWGAHFAAQGINRFVTESAAENVALDPEARDISLNEPSLLWLVVDIAGAVVDLGAVLQALRPVARAAIASGRIAEFATAARRVVPEAAEQLVASLRRRLGSGATATAAAAGAVADVSGASRSLPEYLDALRSQSAARGSAGRWDHANQPRGLANTAWEPGMPIDMPNTAGTYPSYDVARPRYWRNRAHFELEARRAGRVRHTPGNTLDPLRGLTDAQVNTVRTSGRAPQYAFPNTPGQTWELEHGVPQRVGGALQDLGLSRGEAARFSRASDPGNLMEVTPLEHSFFDAEAHGFGRLRGDASGALWAGTRGADTRLQNTLRDMTDSEIRALIDRTRGMDFTRTARTRQLRDDLRAASAERNLGVTVP